MTCSTSTSPRREARSRRSPTEPDGTGFIEWGSRGAPHERRNRRPERAVREGSGPAGFSRRRRRERCPHAGRGLVALGAGAAAVLAALAQDHRADDARLALRDVDAVGPGTHVLL